MLSQLCTHGVSIACGGRVADVAFDCQNGRADQTPLHHTTIPDVIQTATEAAQLYTADLGTSLVTEMTSLAGTGAVGGVWLVIMQVGTLRAGAQQCSTRSSLPIKFIAEKETH